LKSWFEEWFSNEFYLKLYQHRDEEDARWIINLIQRTLDIKTKSKVLDVACGSGRHSIELARRGFDVTGFDLSDYLIKEANICLKESPEKNLKVKFYKRDMRDFYFGNSFDMAVNIFTSFGYFDTDRENFKVIENVAKSLKRKGYFVFDFLNKVHLINNLVPYSRKKFGNISVVIHRKIENDFVMKEIVLKNGSKKRKFKEILKLYSPDEFEKTFKFYGLKIKKTFGDYFGNEFNENKSARLVVFSQKV